MLKNKLLSAMGGAPANYIEDVFSTYLYTGNGSTQTINNGIDLAGKGGLTWIKSRSNATENLLYDTARGAYNYLISSTTGAQSNGSPTGLSAFNADGFSVAGTTIGGGVNGSGATYASWTFRKQPKFFDVVTYTGNGTAGRQIPHSLESVPGCIIVKRTNTTASWIVYHRSVGNTAALVLNDTGSSISSSAFWNNTTPTSSVFTVGSANDVNASGSTYVAYLFAHNAGGFGLTGTDNVISCGSFTTDGSGNATVNLGYEPQWVLYKHTAIATDWNIFDNMRGMPVGSQGLQLKPNSTAADNQTTGYYPTSTGFQAVGVAASQPQIYIAIRRGPMKTPTSGTSVFDVETFTGGASTRTLTSGFPPDMTMLEYRSSWNYPIVASRLTGKGKLIANQTDAENTTNTSWIVTDFDSDTGTTKYNDYGGGNLSSRSVSNGFVSWMFRRAPGFFDEVCYTGDGTAGRDINHNLGVTPEMIVVKKRSSSTDSDWAVYHSGLSQPYYYIRLNLSNALLSDPQAFDSGNHTATTFSVGLNVRTNGSSGATYVAYLFASCPGVSKVGSYTGTGTTQQINCGFTAGARFVLIKRTDSTGDWYVWDSARGIIAGNDPYLLLNSTAAEVTGTDYVDPVSSGFEISSTAPAAINASGGTFIFLAIA